MTVLSSLTSFVCPHSFDSSHASTNYSSRSRVVWESQSLLGTKSSRNSTKELASPV